MSDVNKDWTRGPMHQDYLGLASCNVSVTDNRVRTSTVATSDNSVTQNGISKQNDSTAPKFNCACCTLRTLRFLIGE